MKIAVLGIKGVPGHHGVEVVVDSLLPHLAQLGHEVTVYAYKTYSKATDDYHGARIVTVSGTSGKNTQMISHMLSASIDTWRRGYDLIHIHSVDPCLLAWLPRSRRGVIATSHGQAYHRKKWGFVAGTMSRLAERWFVRIPDVVTSVSKPLADYYRDRYGREVLYIPNGVNIRQAPDRSLLQKWQLEPGGFLFASAGRIERTKGLDTLLEGYRCSGAAMPLVIAGGGAGTDSAYFDYLVKTRPEGVRFVGFLTGDELQCLYAYARVFLFPSEYEAMSMALLEGLSFGVPTIYSDTPENLAVAEGIAYPFKVSDAGALSAELKRVLGNYEEAAALASKARQQVIARHDWKAIARAYDQVYRTFEAQQAPRSA